MSAVLFGEIVEPSTRALIDDDLEDYPDYIKVSPEWTGNYNVPDKINSLIFLESRIIKEVIHTCVLVYEKPLCKLTNGGIEIFVLPNSQYLVVYYEETELNTGQIVETLEKWIHVAKEIYTITSASICNYQNPYYTEKPVSLIRVLSQSEHDFKYNTLEQPNLVTGLGANILSYCIHQSLKKCTLFIIYMDKSPLDSYSCAGILEVFRKLHLPIKNSNIKISISSNNLYM